jgi:hypothetical protein
VSDESGEYLPEVLRDAGEDDDEDLYIVGVRETTDPESWTLMFMESYDDGDEQEISLGMDTYCLVVDPGQATCYGGVLECEVGDAALFLRLTEDAAGNLGVPTELRFALDLDAEKLAMLRRGLTRVLTSGRPDAVPQHLAV